ncbi:MAG TPA: methyltransferase domain-containing protein [Micromonosporaceae bacterium]|nr:methyltransferase domain-containing protein [Micromonosporaceae bacterium]
MPGSGVWMPGSGVPVDLDQTRRDWTTLGAADPLWAVLVAPGKRGGRWDVEEFLATGRAEVGETVQWLAGLGLPTRWRRALDFGCGVGRLSQALTAYADEVVGVDISPPMLAAARELDRGEGALRFVLNEVADLGQFPDASFDLVYSSLVLQHLPRPAVDRYLAEFLRLLRPDGTVVVQVPTRVRRTPKGLIWRYAPYPWIRWVQRRVLGYPAPMRMTTVPARELDRLVAAHGGVVVGRTADHRHANWQLAWFALRHA